MANLVLVNPPYSLKQRYGRLVAAGATLPHLGLLMLGAALRESGHGVTILDGPAQGLDRKTILEEVRLKDPDILGITSVTATAGAAGELARAVKKINPRIRIVAGGPHVTALAKEVLEAGPDLDFLVMGEGDRTFPELADALSAGRDARKVPGLAFLENRKTCFTKKRAPVTDLDELPFPAWDLLPGFPGAFRPTLFRYRSLPAAHLVTSRGCPHQCVFCDNSVFGTRTRQNSADYVLAMMRELYQRFGVREILFEDDRFLTDPERARAICEGLLSRGPALGWSCLARVDNARDTGLLRLMARAGCWQMSFGIESGDQGILDAAGKKTILEQIRNTLENVRAAGIRTKGFFILGLPGETRQTMSRTLEFALTLALDDVSVFMATPFPGTRLYKQLGPFGADFEKMNVMEPVFPIPGLGREDLFRMQRRFFRRFYLRPRIIRSHLKQLACFPGIIPGLVPGINQWLRPGGKKS